MGKQTRRVKAGQGSRRKAPRASTHPGRAASSVAAALNYTPRSNDSSPERDLRAIVLEKTNAALRRVIDAAPKETLVEALRTQTPFDALIHIASSREAVAAIASQIEDPLRSAKARAAKHLLALLTAEGGPIGVEEVSERLGISRAAVDKRRNAGTLIGISDRSRAIAYPSWQFTDRGVLPGLDDALRAIGVQDPWMRMQFFLTHDPDLQARPLDALRKGRREDVAAAANRYGRQGDDG